MNPGLLRSHDQIGIDNIDSIEKRKDGHNLAITIQIFIFICFIIKRSPGSLSSPAAWKAVQGEWYGDRIEILVSSGDVYLQFENEN